ncbi:MULTISPECIES: DUF58 domain-containing protein [Luteimonas]|uniref:DUF58 domain-containing protein n=1 Tax=Luteimonas TaxID=83614 RepID=UPI000C7DC4B8|nr:MULTISPECIES: DUF58 domain-containing protein [Luteimonas]
MTSDPIPPSLRARLGALRIVPRRAAGRGGIGLHASRSRGAGLEFAQYRAYEPGDEPRQIDWKLYGRSDRFFVREAERESPLRVWIVLDASASMAQADEARPDWSRFDAARQLAACIAEIALRQGDAFGLVALHDAGLQLVPADGGLRQRDRLRLQLQGLTPGRAFPTTAQLSPVWERIGSDDLVLAIGDWFDEAAVALLERLAAARREVVALQLLTVEERDFPFADGRRFVDPETGESLLGDGPALRKAYLQRFGDAQRALRARFDAAGIRFASAALDVDVDAVLQPLFGADAIGGGR